MAIMLVRLFLAFWMFFTSAFGSALCCCVPLSLPLLRTKSVAAEPVRPSESHCSRCKSNTQARTDHSTPDKKCPCGPYSPGHKECPCRSHHLTSVIVENLSVEIISSNACSFTFVLPAILPTEHHLNFAETLLTNHTGPPPLSGVDLLHRLHILVC